VFHLFTRKHLTVGFDSTDLLIIQQIIRLQFEKFFLASMFSQSL